MSQEIKWSDQPRWSAKLSLSNTSFLVLSPIAAVIMATWFVQRSGFVWSDLFMFLLMFLFTGLGITAGYHRLFSHRAWSAHPAVKAFLLFFGAGAAQNSAVRWCSDHRFHHKFVDTKSDPYNIKQGFFHAHMGWVFRADPEERSLDNVPDLVADPLLSFQHRHYLLLLLLSGTVFPTLLSWWLFDRPLAGFVWGGLVRTVAVHHFTFLINSAAHVFGKRNFSSEDSSRDSAVLALIAMGEGYHNFHHTFPSDYRNGYLWYHWDPSKWMIAGLSKIGFADKLRRTPDEVVLKARIAEQSKTLIQQAREAAALRFQQNVEQLRARVERAVEEWTRAREEYKRWKQFERSLLPAPERKTIARKWKQELNERRLAFKKAWKDFYQLPRMMPVRSR